MILTPLFVLGFLGIVLSLTGIIEYYYHQKLVNTIPIRIHVNGTRGKSSVTRLIAAGLREGGIRTFAKTTGTAPRVIDAFGKDHIIHRLRSPSIGEQVRLLKYFAQEKPDAVVIECMAVQPQYQWISEHQMVRSNIGVITNVRPDHMEEMGPTLVDVAYSLCNTIPVDGKLITGEEIHLEIFRNVAKENGSTFVESNEISISDDELNQFSYIEHPMNIAVALDVCNEAGVERRIALAGMYKMKPDLGALVAWNLKKDNRRIQFINGMAANDPVSTLKIWKFVVDRYNGDRGTCVFFNTRDDRPGRTRQLIELTLQEIKPDHFIVRGDKIKKPITRVQKHSPNTNIFEIGFNKNIDFVVDKLLGLSNCTLIYAIGNQVGSGQEILTKIAKYKRDD